MGDDERYSELEHELKQTEGYRIKERLEEFTSSRYVLVRNFERMRETYNQYIENWPEIEQSKPDVGIETYQNEFLRVLHNYLASVHSIYEHAQALKRHLNDEFVEAYQHEVDRLDIDEIHSFLKDMRNYIQHRKIPKPNRRLHLDVTDRMTGEYETHPQITLSKDKLLESDRWNSTSREVMSEFDDGEIVLVELTDKYQNALDEFYNNLFEALGEIYEEEFVEHDEILEEMYELKPDNVHFNDHE